MVADLVEGAVGGIFRFIVRVLTEIILEFMIRGVGYLVCRLFSKKVDPDSISVFISGVLVWLLISVGGYKIYTYLDQKFAIDNCLDSGGRFNYEQNVCGYM